MAFKQVLLTDHVLAPGAEHRILPNLSIEDYDRLHIHISNDDQAVKSLSVHILFGTPVGSKILLADSTIWFEENAKERDFSFTTSNNYGGVGFVMSVPVVAPLLYDVVLRNLGRESLNKLHVALLAQEI